MARYTPTPSSVDVGHDDVILDTSVFIAALDVNDRYHSTARGFLDTYDTPFVVPIPVVVETWGVLVGSRKRRDLGEQLLDWLEVPGNARLLTSDHSPNPSVFEVIRKVKVDYVDVKVSIVGHMMSDTLAGKPWPAIATTDTAHFLRCMRAFSLQFRLYDVRTGEMLVF